MLIGNSETNGSESSNNIKDVTSDNFMEEVIELSKTTPVIVDFWAPWCGPCKELGPNIEKAVNNANGKQAKLQHGALRNCMNGLVRPPLGCVVW